MTDITIVIRTVDERTLDVCQRLLETMCEEENIFIVSNITPFSEAVRQAFLIGLNNGKKWTLVIDADILISERNVRCLIDIGNMLLKYDKKFFSLNGVLYDKFWMDARVCGLHLYNTSVLSDAIQYIEMSQKNIRPETYVKEMMQKKGHNCYVCDLCVGLHDFFQSYASIFRKGMLHIKKHRHIEEYYEKWSNLKERDKDFEWLCLGIDCGKRETAIQVDYTYFSRIIKEKNFNFEQQKEISMKEVQTALDEYVKCKDRILIYRPMSFWNKIRREFGKVERKYEILLKNIEGEER